MRSIQIRVAQPADAEQLLAIYAPYVEKTAITFEYTVPTVMEFRRRIVQTLQRYPYLVAVEGGRLVGYAYVSPFQARKAYDWSVETSIYVAPTVRHHGIGKQLYDKIESVCRSMNITNLNACIGYPQSDDDPHLDKNSADFHCHRGFQLAGHFHSCGYKFDRWYDIIWMEKFISSHEKTPASVKNFDAVRAQFNLS